MEDDPSSKAVLRRVAGPTQSGETGYDHAEHEGRWQTSRRLVYAGSRLKPEANWEGPA